MVLVNYVSREERRWLVGMWRVKSVVWRVTYSEGIAGGGGGEKRGSASKESRKRLSRKCSLRTHKFPRNQLRLGRARRQRTGSSRSLEWQKKVA